MKTKRLIHSLCLATGLGTLNTALGQSNQASQVQLKDSLMEVISVTAQKRIQPIQEVPVSVSSLSGKQLDDLHLSDVTDIAQQVTNLQVSAWSPQLTIFNLRGVSQNNFVDNLEGPIAVYQDDAYIASLNGISGQLFDLKRVEVLRGPQGTLFGRNATGGLIHYISRDASEDYTNGYMAASLGSFNRQSIEGAIGGQLSTNVRGRIAFRHERADGYILPMDLPTVDQRAIGGANGYGIRGTLEIDITDSLVAEIIAKYSKDDDVPTGGYVFENCDFDDNELCPIDQSGRAIVTGGVVSGDPHVHMNDSQGHFNRKTHSYTAKLTYGINQNIEFVAISHLLNMQKSYLEDGDAFPAPILAFGQDADVQQFTQEIRVSGSNPKLDWQVGAYYMDYSIDGRAITLGAPNIGVSVSLFEAGIIEQPVTHDGFPFDGRSERPYQLDVDNTALFAQLDYKLANDLNLVAGLRYSKDNKHLDWLALFSSDQQITAIPYAATSNNRLANAPTVLTRLDENKIDYNDYAARLSLNKQFSPNLMGFIAWNRGIKGGNWTLSAAISPQRFVHAPEVVNAFEVGFKSQISNSLRINGTGYYYDYRDYQTFVAIPPDAAAPLPQVGNSDATAYGAELEITASITNNLDLQLGLASNQSKVERVEAGANPVLDAEFPNAPNVSANYLLRYHIPWVKEAKLIAQFDGTFYGEQFLEVTNGQGSKQQGYNVSNLSLTWSNNEWMMSLWTKNLFDKRYKTYSLDLGVLGVTTYYAGPRTVGLSARYRF